jgi:hypothetical protein
MTLKRLYYKLTTEVPKEELNFSVEDFQKGMRWAKSLPHPFIKNRSLDEYFTKRMDSVHILEYLNTIIRENNKNV